MAGSLLRTFDRTSASTMWLSVPPDTSLKLRLARPLASACKREHAGRHAPMLHAHLMLLLLLLLLLQC